MSKNVSIDVDIDIDGVKSVQNALQFTKGLDKDVKYNESKKSGKNVVDNELEKIANSIEQSILKADLIDEDADGNQLKNAFTVNEMGVGPNQKGEVKLKSSEMKPGGAGEYAVIQHEGSNGPYVISAAGSKREGLGGEVNDRAKSHAKTASIRYNLDIDPEEVGKRKKERQETGVIDDPTKKNVLAFETEDGVQYTPWVVHPGVSGTGYLDHAFGMYIGGLTSRSPFGNRVNEILYDIWGKRDIQSRKYMKNV